MSKAKSIALTIPPRIAIDAIAARLMDFSGLRHESGQRLLRTYYDSFDWRLYRRGLALAVEKSQGQSRLVCSTFKNGEIQAACELDMQPPRFAWELPDKRLCERLSPILETRALLPQAAIEFVGKIFASADGSLRAILAHCCAFAPDARQKKHLGDWLIVETSKDAQGALHQLLAFLGNDFGLEPSDPPLLLQALAALGKRPGDPALQSDLVLDPDLRADAATKPILRHLFAAIEINEAGVIQRIDTEFLHDFRIAVRRTRSALGQIKSVFPDRTVRFFAPRFAWLGQITSKPRDLDVYLLGFEELKANLPPNFRDALDPLRDFLQQNAENAHVELARKLSARRYRTLLASWRKFLETPVPKRPRAVHALRPIGTLADRRIWKTYRRVLKQGRAIRPDSPAESFHELRKTCKKLRYLLEFFQSLYPPEKVRPLIKLLKGLQDQLGAFQDIHAQIDTLHQFSLTMRRMALVPTDTLLAMGALIGQLDGHQKALRESYAERFDEFTQAGNQARFRQLFARQRKTEDG